MEQKCLFDAGAGITCMSLKAFRYIDKKYITIKNTTPSPYPPQTNAQVEVYNKTIATY